MKIVLFQTIQFRIRTQIKCKYSLWKNTLFQAIHFNQAVLIQLIPFSMRTDFVDFTKAFDSKMEQILLAYGIPKETVAAITILYRNTKV